MSNRRYFLVAAVCALAACAWLANYVTATVGAVPLGFGIAVTAGTFLAGLALVLRDVVHEFGGMVAVLVAIVAGGVVSYYTTPALLAYASTVTFVVAELADAAVYSRLRERSKPLGVAASGLLGGCVDTALFLYLARDVPFIAAALGVGLVVGQLVVKVGMSLLAAVALGVVERRAVTP